MSSIWDELLHSSHICSYPDCIGGFVSDERVGWVVLVVEITLRAQIEIETFPAFPTHALNAMLLAVITDDIWVLHSCRQRVCVCV